MLAFVSPQSGYVQGWGLAAEREGLDSRLDLAAPHELGSVL